MNARSDGERGSRAPPTRSAIGTPSVSGSCSTHSTPTAVPAPITRWRACGPARSAARAGCHPAAARGPREADRAARGGELLGRGDVVDRRRAGDAEAREQREGEGGAAAEPRRRQRAEEQQRGGGAREQARPRARAADAVGEEGHRQVASPVDGQVDGRGQLTKAIGETSPGKG